MQTGRRRGNRARCLGEHGLVAFEIGKRGGALDVRRQRRRTVMLEVGLDVALELQNASAKISFALDDGVEPFCELQSLPDLGAVAGFDERCPPVVAEILDEQQFDIGFRRPDTRRDDFRVVENEQVTGLEKIFKVPKLFVANLTGRAVDDQHARGGPVGERLLGDQFFREVESEVGGLHRFRRIQRINVNTALRRRPVVSGK